MHYVALGDSFTEGVGDNLPDGQVRGWADLVAAGLAASGEELWYSNLAIRGRLIEPIVNEQLEPALALSPTPSLMTFAGGGNDLMRRGYSVDHVLSLGKRVVDRCGEEGVQLLLVTGGDPTGALPRGDMMAARADEWMGRIGELADEFDHVTFVDNYTDADLRRAEYWAPDRLHLNPLGHARVAARVLTALGVQTELPTAELSESLRSGLLVEARYVARHVVPWLGRRLTGRSSGDGRVPKHPDWVKIEPLS